MLPPWLWGKNSDKAFEMFAVRGGMGRVVGIKKLAEPK